MGAPVADKNRRIRQEAIRAQLAAYGHHTQLLDIANKIESLCIGQEFELQKLKEKASIHFRLLNKYLPDLKSVEVDATGDDRRAPTADPFYKADPEEWRQSAGDHNQGHSTH